MVHGDIILLEQFINHISSDLTSTIDYNRRALKKNQLIHSKHFI